MPEETSQRFKLAVDEIPPNETNDEVAKIQQYLARYGYLQAAFDPGNLDEPTQQSLRFFQERMGVESTGSVDPETVAALERHRCGVPDVPLVERAFSALPPAFTLRGCDYEGDFRTLSYAFALGTSDLQGAQEKQAVRDAFETWQQHVSIDFVEVGLQNQPNFTIGWFGDDHGDGAPFDGVGNTLAHAFYPPPCGGPHSGKLHFDDAETWALADGVNKFDTETVALHEIGHLLGLDHSSIAGSVMFPTYGGERRTLTQDDIDGVQALYGRRGQKLDILVHLERIGDQTALENEFAGTRGQSRRLEGFQIRIDPTIDGLSLRYMAHLQGAGDLPFVDEGNFIGTRGESRRLEGFAIELTGSEAANFNVFYMAHLQNMGDTGFFQNGQFCGTRGESRRVEGMLVRVEPR